MSEIVFEAQPAVIDIVPVSPEGLRQDERLWAYRTRFKDTTRETLAHADSFSDHFEIFADGCLLGGFRLTPIGGGRSEVEGVFKESSFLKHSFEFGRFWIRRECQSKKLGLQAVEAILSYFDRTVVNRGEVTIWVEIPMTAMACRTAPCGISAPAGSGGVGTEPDPASEYPSYGSMPAMLKALLIPYVGEGFPSIDLAAEMMHCSRRTLQRRLREEGSDR